MDVKSNKMGELTIDSTLSEVFKIFKLKNGHFLRISREKDSNYIYLYFYKNIKDCNAHKDHFICQDFYADIKGYESSYLNCLYLMRGSYFGKQSEKILDKFVKINFQKLKKGEFEHLKKIQKISIKMASKKGVVLARRKRNDGDVRFEIYKDENSLKNGDTPEIAFDRSKDFISPKNKHNKHNERIFIILGVLGEKKGLKFLNKADFLFRGCWDDKRKKV